MSPSDLLPQKLKEELIEFTQSLIRIKSLSGQEQEIIQLTDKKMRSLGYDEVTIDSMGNIIGRIGDGDKSILFDSHVDTVDVKDENEWDVPPFSGQIIDGLTRSGFGGYEIQRGSLPLYGCAREKAGTHLGQNGLRILYSVRGGL